MENLNNNMLVILEFLEKAGISVENMTINYDEKNSKMVFYKAEYGTDENNIQTITVKLDESKNSVLIKNDVRREYDIENHGNDPMTSYQTYRVDNTQTLTKFKATNGLLNSYTVSIFQQVKEDTMGGGDWIIVDINTLSEFLDEENIRYLPYKHNFSQVEQTIYSIPSDYKITEGFARVEEITSQDLIQKM